jgi:hypothetical protein
MRFLWIFASILVLSVVFSGVVLAQSSPVTIILLDVKQEYVLIKNTGNTAVDLNGWVLHDHDYDKGSVYSYTFGELILQPGDILQMQSGRSQGKNDEDVHKQAESTYYLRWSDRNVWNNKCDIAYLLDAQETLIAEKHSGEEIDKWKREDCK